jgi:RNA polymerase sigma-70 factor (ECF subfamily)
MWTRRPRPSLELAPGASADPLADVAARAKAGDRAAVRELLAAIGPSLLRVARQVLGPGHPEIPDVAQEAAWGVLRGLESFRGECTLQHFACRVAVLTSMNVRRRERSQQFKAQQLSQLWHTEGVEAPSPERVALEQRAASALRELLDTLPVAQAEVLCLHHVVGLTALEIAALGGTPVETVRSRLRLGRKALMARVLESEQLLDTLGVSDEHAR